MREGRGSWLRNSRCVPRSHARDAAIASSIRTFAPVDHSHRPPPSVVAKANFEPAAVLFDEPQRFSVLTAEVARIPRSKRMRFTLFNNRARQYNEPAARNCQSIQCDTKSSRSDLKLPSRCSGVQIRQKYWRGIIPD